jgi:membrane protease YdiL (CAAX protease family)
VSCVAKKPDACSGTPLTTFGRMIPLLALTDEIVVLFLIVNFSATPWDFAVILAVLAVIIPWRGAARMRDLLKRDALTTADRLSLYGSTIAFQWIIVAFVAWRAYSRKVNLSELGLVVSDSWKVIGVAAVLTLMLCAIQFASLRRILRMSVGERGPVFGITERIMPHSSEELLVFTALACTAGLSEEFLYRGFVFAVFARMLSNTAAPMAVAAIVSSIWFGVAHLYQGRRGIITTFVVGMIFCLARIFTGSLLPPIVAHIGVDFVAGLSVWNSVERA